MIIRLLIAAFLCLIWTTSRAQTIDPKVKIGVNTIYLSQFTVQEASDDNVRATGVRVSFSDYDYIPFEFGIHVYGGYGDVASASFGFNLAWLITGPKLQFKTGLSLSKLDLENVEANEDEFGPHVGDVHFTSVGTEFKPYIECEWAFSRFSSLFIHTGYRIINGEKSVTTAVEGTGLHSKVTKRNENFFYSASGLEFGVGLSVNL